MSRDIRKSILLVAILLSGMATTVYSAGAGPGSLGAAPAPAPVQAGPPTAPLVAPGIAVYFTDPTLDGYRGGPETALLAAVDAARVTVDLAAYDLDLWGLRDALLSAQRRGVRVRLVFEAGSSDRPEIQALAAGGIPIVFDRPDGLMHNKFVIIDRHQVWTGSMNFTLNGAYRNDNHLIAMTSPEAVSAYQAEFDEMFVAGLFGAFSPPGRPVEFFLDGGEGRAVPVQVLFSPDDDPQARIVELILGAETSIRFMAFSFTADEIGQAMLEQAAAGLTVQGVFDESQLQSNVGSEYDYLLAAGLDVRIDGSPDKMHHKVIIIDDRIVIAGSYNFSASAEHRNDENTVIIFDEVVAAVFLEEWERVFAMGR